MKRINSLVLIFGFLLLSLGAISQPPPPPSDPSDSNHNLPVGSPGAPIGNGSILLITLALAYAAGKIYTYRSEKEVA